MVLRILGIVDKKTGESETSRDWSKSLGWFEAPKGGGLGDFKVSRLPFRVNVSEVPWTGGYSCCGSKAPQSWGQKSR